MIANEVLEKLRNAVGPDNVLTDPLDLMVYGYDTGFETRLHPKPPDVVVRPGSTEEVSAIMKIAWEHEVPVTPRAAASGMTSGSVAVQGGIVMEMLRMNRLLEMDLDNLQVFVEPGMVHAKLNELLKPYGFFFPVDPGSSKTLTLGGMVANNSSGMRAVKYGTTRNYVLGLEVVMPDGTVIWTGGQNSRCLKSVSGYDLTQLMVCSEGTLGVITKIRLKVLPIPEKRGVVFAAFNDLKDLGETVVELFRHKASPSAIEVMDKSSIQAVNLIRPETPLPEAEGILMLEIDGSPAEVKHQAQQCAKVCEKRAREVRWSDDPAEIQEIWSGRQLVGAAMTRVHPGTSRVYAAEDIGVPITKVPEALIRLQEISREHDIPLITFGHVGDGNLHAGMVVDFRDQERLKKAAVVADIVQRMAIEMGGTSTAEHGVGAARARYMEAEHGPALDVMRAIKRALDPKNIMNPGKMAL